MPAAAIQASQPAIGFGELGLRSAAADRQAADRQAADRHAADLDVFGFPARHPASDPSELIAAHFSGALAAGRASGSAAVAAAAQAASLLAAQGCHLPTLDASRAQLPKKFGAQPAPPRRVAAARRSCPTSARSSCIWLPCPPAPRSPPSQLGVTIARAARRWNRTFYKHTVCR